MRFGIVGAGAVGCLLAGLLTRSGQDVVLLARRSEVAGEILMKGIQIDVPSGRLKVIVRATSEIDCLSDRHIVILSVKSYDTSIASREIKPHLSDEASILTLQNGLGNLEAIDSELHGQGLVGGSTTLGSTLTSSGHVAWASAGTTIVGDPKGRPSQSTKRLASILSKAGLPAKTTSNLKQVLWAKALISSAINPLTALLRITNGELITRKNVRLLAAEIVQEGERVANAEGILLKSNPVRTMMSVARSTANNKSSMLQDVENRKRTEIAAINGALVDFGRKSSVPTPLNSALAWAIIRLETDDLKLPPLHTYS